MAEDKESWDRAKSLLLGAVDVMMQLKDTKKDPGTPSTSSQGASLPSAAQSSLRSSNKPSVYRRLFGYKPSKVCSSKRTKGKGKARKKAVNIYYVKQSYTSDSFSVTFLRTG